jgi:hypothetical protein
VKNRTERSYWGLITLIAEVDAGALALPRELAPLYAKVKAHTARAEKLIPQASILRRGPHYASKELRAKCDLMREAYMIPIGRAGRKHLRFTSAPARAFKTPPKRSTPSQLVASARAMAKAVRPHWKHFAEIGFARDAAAKMMKSAIEIEKSLKDGDVARRISTKHLREIESEVRAARQIIDIMDGMMLAHSRGDDGYVLLKAWRHAKRIPKKMGRPRKRREA